MARRKVDLAQQGPPEATCRGSHKRAGHGRVDLTGRSLPQLDLATDLAHPGRCTSRLRVSRTKEFSQREAMSPRAALGDSGLPPSTPASVLRKEGPGLTASEPGAVSDNTTSRRLVAAEGSRSSADLRQMLLAKKQRTQDLPVPGHSHYIPPQSLRLYPQGILSLLVWRFVFWFRVLGKTCTNFSAQCGPDLGSSYA